MNRNNYRVVLEEILKVGDISREELPPDIDLMSPEQQVSLFNSVKTDTCENATSDDLLINMCNREKWK